VPEWARDAACADLTPEEADLIFFPSLGGRATAARASVGRAW